MKIMYATDIHESYVYLKRLFELTSADLYVIAGDLLYCAFRSWKQAAAFIELQQAMHVLGLRYRLPGTREDIAEQLVAGADADERQRRQATDFLSMVAAARRSMLRKYERFARLFEEAGDAEIITIPGNYDMDLAPTALAPWDLHRKSRVIKGLKFSGYGGAPVYTPGVPECLRAHYREYFDSGRRLHSEPFAFFRRENPDVVVTHHPPYGYLDRLASYGCIGSIGLRDFVDQTPPKMVLSGHLHEDWGAVFKGGTAFINPSNFGRFIEVHRIKKGGSFAELHFEQGTFSGGCLCQLEGRTIYNVEIYQPVRGKFRLLVSDIKRYRYLSRITRKQKHIKAIRLYNRITGFFRRHETPATRQRTRQLEAFVQDIAQDGHEIAFHLLGSMNFGMAEEASDADVVLYYYDPLARHPDDIKHPVPGYVESRLADLQAAGLEISICDCLNLFDLKKAILAEDSANQLLQRFMFYDTTCRVVNDHPVRELEDLFLQKEDFRFRVEEQLTDAFRMIISSFRHAFSFKKYQMRLQDKGMTVPPYIEELIWQYLEQKMEKR